MIREDFQRKFVTFHSSRITSLGQFIFGDSLINNHPFLDGNKRTGITAAGLFLRQNGYRLMATNAEIEVFTLRVATKRLEMAEIAAWLQVHSSREES